MPCPSLSESVLCCHVRQSQSWNHKCPSGLPPLNYFPFIVLSLPFPDSLAAPLLSFCPATSHRAACWVASLYLVPTIFVSRRDLHNTLQKHPFQVLSFFCPFPMLTGFPISSLPFHKMFTGLFAFSINVPLPPVSITAHILFAFSMISLNSTSMTMILFIALILTARTWLSYSSRHRHLTVCYIITLDL